MLSSVIRILICSIVGIGLWRLYKRSKTKNPKSLRRKYIGIEVSLILVINIWWFENLFVTFPSPQAVFQYTQIGDIEYIIEGEASTLIISQNLRKEKNTTIVEKNNAGWKISPPFSMRSVDTKHAEQIAVFVERYKNTQDYYLSIMYTGKEAIEIQDNRNSSFIDSFNKTRNNHIYYAYIKNYDSEYEIQINGTIVN